MTRAGGAGGSAMGNVQRCAVDSDGLDMHMRRMQRREDNTRSGWEAVGRRHSTIGVRRDAFVVRPLGRREAVQPCADRWRQHSVLHRGQTS